MNAGLAARGLQCLSAAWKVAKMKTLKENVFIAPVFENVKPFRGCILWFINEDRTEEGRAQNDGAP